MTAMSDGVAEVRGKVAVMWHRDGRGRACGLLMSAALALSVGGCGTVGFAPDSVVESPKADKFLLQIGNVCGKREIGNRQIDYLLSPGSQDTYFVDETSKLYFGDVSREQYASDINGFYPTDTNQAALDCIFAQLPR
jgi:hypothetical protein